MKRMSILAALLCLFCCACSSTGGTAKDDRKLLVSAIGFDGAGEQIKVSVELIIINTENFESNLTPRVMTGKGDTIREAIANIGNGLTRQILLNHCGVIAVGSGISANRFHEICDYCFSEHQITMSAYMIATEDCETLLDGEPESSVTVGYDIMGIIEQESAQTGVAYNSRYFEVETLRERGKNSFALPHFKRVKVGVEVDGMTLFHQNKQVAVINTEQAGMYAIITGGLRKGMVSLGSKEYYIDSRRLDCSNKGGGSVTLCLRLSTSTSKEDCKRLEQRLQDFRTEVEKQTNNDVLGLADILNERFRNYDPKENNGWRGVSFTVQCKTSKGVHDE